MGRGRPPRLFAVGDVITVHSEALGAWTASQVTGIDTAAQCAAVLALDWSGPEPATVADLGDVRPLRLTHHSWGGRLAHRNHGWVLPKSFTVIGSLPPLVTAPTHAYSPVWGRGEQLARQRLWDSGDRREWTPAYALSCSADELAAALTGGARAGITHLTVRGITRLDCAVLVAAFPDLTWLSLSGDMGTLTSAVALNQLPRLRGLAITELFGMGASDTLLPCHAAEVEELSLYGIPADYASAMRRTWQPHVQHGVRLDVRGARSPEWVAANSANPLRDWDGRGHIPRTAYREAVAQYENTRRAFLAAITGGNRRGDKSAAIGRAFGAALNALDSRSPFIETVEREELFDALAGLVDEAQATTGLDLSAARAALLEGVDAVRDW